jgi:triacylglycerol lipase
MSASEIMPSFRVRDSTVAEPRFLRSKVRANPKLKANSNPYAGEFAWTRVDDAFGWSALLGPSVGGEDVSPYAAAARADDLKGLPAAFISVAVLDLLMDHGSAPLLPKARISMAADRDSRDALRRAFHG